MKICPLRSALAAPSVSEPVTLKSEVNRKKYTHREVRRPMVFRIARESRRGVAPKRVS